MQYSFDSMTARKTLTKQGVMRNRLFATLMVATLVGLPSAYGVPTLKLSDGVTILTIADQSLNDSSGIPGMVRWAGTIGAWTIDVEFESDVSAKGAGKPYSGSAINPDMHMSVSASSRKKTPGAANLTLTVWFSDDDFGPLANQMFYAAAGGTLANSQSTLLVRSFGDTGNNLFGDDGIANSSVLFNQAGGFSSNLGAPLGGPLDYPYSLTLMTTITHRHLGISTLNSSVDVDLKVPDGGSTLLLLGSALGALGFMTWRRKE